VEVSMLRVGGWVGPIKAASPLTIVDSSSKSTWAVDLSLTTFALRSSLSLNYTKRRGVGRRGGVRSV